MFGGGFGFSGGSKRRNSKTRGDDVLYHMNLSFEEAVYGCEKDIKIGDWLEFEITFACMYSLCTSKDVKIIYKGEI